MKRVWLQGLSITIFVFALLALGNSATDFKIFTAFDTIGQALKDFELTDYAFSKLRPEPKPEQRIILVNIGALSRRELAQEISIVSKYGPKVIGVDGIFTCEGGLRDSVNCPALLDTLGNLMLSQAIQEAGNVVLAEKLMQSDSLSKTDIDLYDSLELPDPIFSDYAYKGFVNLPTNAVYQEDVKLCRSIFPRIAVNGKDHLAFSVQIANRYDSAVTRKFLERNKAEEIINYRGNIEVRQLKLKSLQDQETAATNFGTMFYVVDVEDVMREDFAKELFKDNIVIMGYLGDYLGDPSWEDKFFTPLNSKVAGRANPDMFGPVVHANAVAMILNQDYVNELPDWGKYAVAFIICLLTVVLFIRIDQSIPQWFDALSVIIQLFEVLVISLIIIYAFSLWNLKLDLSIAIGVSALVGPAYDIFKSFQNEINRRLTIRREKVSTP